MLATTFLLEVLGGVGAVWGGAEVVYLRNVGNADQWRVVCIMIGAVLFARWIALHVRGQPFIVKSTTTDACVSTTSEQFSASTLTKPSPAHALAPVPTILRRHFSTSADGRLQGLPMLPPQFSQSLMTCGSEAV